MNTGDIVVKCLGLEKKYKMGSTEVHALRGIDLELYSGFSLIVGPSGCGKSTLLNIVGCIDTPSKGQIWVNNRNINSLNENERTAFRRENIGYIFQSFSLIQSLNLYDNIIYPIIRNTKHSKSDRIQKADRLLEEVGLAGYGKRFPRELSGGQQQRVAIARSLISDPKLVIADEPTASLDSESSQKILNLLEKMRDEHGTSTILASHDSHVIERVDKKITIKDGLVQN